MRWRLTRLPSRVWPPQATDSLLLMEIYVWCWHHIIDMAEKERRQRSAALQAALIATTRIAKMAATSESDNKK
ncbi:unnamed protein product [Urochloa humidicola]